MSTQFPIIVRAPGRVNLIGEHVDYNDGFVLPMALPLETVLRLRPRNDRRVELYSKNFGTTTAFDLEQIEKQDEWIDYVQGVACELKKRGIELRGFEGEIESNVPVASGLSSSAALEVAAALAFLHLAEVNLPPTEIALLCQAAENKFVGVNSGIMDQMAVAACIRDHALLLDCRSLEIEQVPFKLKEHAIIVTDSAAPRELAGSAYNERRAQCEEGLAALKTVLPEIKSLRDVTLEDSIEHRNLMTPIVAKRIMFVVTEIKRTQLAVEALKAGDLAKFGNYMNASHNGLRYQYEVTSHELDWLADWSQAQPGVLGSRMTGAGFGGCTVTLIEKANTEQFMHDLPIAYEQATGRKARCWACDASEGARASHEA